MANRQIKDFTQDTAPSGSDLVLKQSSGGGIGSTKSVTIDNLLSLVVTTGDITQVNITAGTGLSGTQNTTTGAHTQTLTLSHLGIESLSDPDADRILFWDDSASAAAWLTVGSNLSLSGTTLSATDTDTQLSTEQVQDIVGAMFSGNTETRASVTYDDSDWTIDVVVDDMTADTQLTSEQVQDIVGAMFSGNTETRVTVTYQDADGTIDVVVDDLDTDTTYSAGNGISLSTTTFSVAAGTGLSQDSSGLSLSHLGLQDLSDPDADMILFWDDSAGAFKWLTAGTNLTISGTTISASGGGGSGDITRVNITAGTGMTGTTDTTSGDHTQTLALSHLGIQSLSDPDADRIMFWDDSEGAMKFLVPNDNLAISGTNLNATDTNTTYSAGNGIALSGTAFAVSAGSGLVQESSGLALDDPINLSQLTESTDATDDKILLWDESASAWKYMTLDDLQDSIDTTGGGGGGSAADDITTGDAAVSLATSSGDVTIDSQAAATIVDGHTGVTIKTASVDALAIDTSKVVDFKIAGGSKTVTLSNNAMDDTMMGTATVTVNATEWLQIKVAGNTRYIPVWS